jgi:hypothetical protein
MRNVTSITYKKGIKDGRKQATKQSDPNLRTKCWWWNVINTFMQRIPLSAKGVHKIGKNNVSDRHQVSDKARHNEEGNIQQTARRN